jgi:CBS domain-containing protein
MTRSVHTIDADESFGYALLLMHEHGFRHLPVIEKGKLVGIVSARSALDRSWKNLSRKRSDGNISIARTRADAAVRNEAQAPSVPPGTCSGCFGVRSSSGRMTAFRSKLGPLRSSAVFPTTASMRAFVKPP